MLGVNRTGRGSARAPVHKLQAKGKDLVCIVKYHSSQVCGFQISILARKEFFPEAVFQFAKL